jgi:hypothetical protein
MSDETTNLKIRVKLNYKLERTQGNASHGEVSGKISPNVGPSQIRQADFVKGRLVQLESVAKDSGL